MSREQVIACNGFGGGCHGMDCPVCDGTGLSTPHRVMRLVHKITELTARLNRAESKLSALLDGIEGLEATWSEAYDSGGSVVFQSFADDLKALREKANG